MTQTQQPEALRLAEILEQYALNPLREVAAELRRQHTRIAELEAQLSAIGAGGVEPLRKPAAVAVPDEREAFEHHFRADDLRRDPDEPEQYLNGHVQTQWEGWQARAALAATQPAAQGVELANCKGGKWLTVVYRDIQPGDESRTIVEHPKVSALSWSHALHDRDAAIAAQAKQGGV